MTLEEAIFEALRRMAIAGDELRAARAEFERLLIARAHHDANASSRVRTTYLDTGFPTAFANDPAVVKVCTSPDRKR